MTTAPPSSSPPDPLPPGEATAASPGPVARHRRSHVPSPWHALFQLLLATLVFLLINALSCQKFARHDTTRGHVSSLSETSRKVVNALDDRTRIIVAFVKDSPLKEKTWRLARAYADARPGRVQARLLDPVRDPESARDLAKRHGLTFKGNAVILIHGKRVEVIPEANLQILRRADDGGMRSIAFAGEDAITAALLRLLEPTPPVIYLIAGKGPWPATTSGNGSDTLRTILPRHHATLKELSLDGLSAIPADAAALLLVNPRYDLSGREVKLLREFWEQRKGGIGILLNPETATPNLEAFLRFHGIETDRRTVMRASTGGVATAQELSVAVGFLPGAELTDSFVNADARFPGTSISLKVDAGRDDLRTRGIRPFALATALPGYWGENNPEDPRPSFDRSVDNPGPLVLAAAVERAAVDDERVRVPAARMVVFSNPHLLDPDALLQVNVDFFFSSLNWLLDRKTMIGIGPAQPIYFGVEMTGRQSRTLHVLLLVALPAFALMLGWFVHQRRRS